VTGLAVLAGIALAWWVLSLAWHPYALCRRCQDRRGRNTGSKATRWGRCGKCDGKGERARFGAQSVRKAIGRPL
jgi:hypothetical protein